MHSHCGGNQPLPTIDPPRPTLTISYAPNIYESNVGCLDFSWETGRCGRPLTQYCKPCQSLWPTATHKPPTRCTVWVSGQFSATNWLILITSIILTQYQGKIYYLNIHFWLKVLIAPWPCWRVIDEQARVGSCHSSWLTWELDLSVTSWKGANTLKYLGVQQRQLKSVQNSLSKYPVIKITPQRRSTVVL